MYVNTAREQCVRTVRENTVLGGPESASNQTECRRHTTHMHMQPAVHSAASSSRGTGIVDVHLTEEISQRVAVLEYLVLDYLERVLVFQLL